MFMQGFVVGFSGAKAYCLHNLAMRTLDVPLSATLQSFITLGAFDTAYQACPYLASLLTSRHYERSTSAPSQGSVHVYACTAVITIRLL